MTGVQTCALPICLIVDKKNVLLPNLIVQRFKPELEKLLILTLLGAHTVEHAGEFCDASKRSRANTLVAEGKKAVVRKASVTKVAQKDVPAAKAKAKNR